MHTQGKGQTWGDGFATMLGDGAVAAAAAAAAAAGCCCCWLLLAAAPSNHALERRGAAPQRSIRPYVCNVLLRCPLSWFIKPPLNFKSVCAVVGCGGLGVLVNNAGVNTRKPTVVRGRFARCMSPLHPSSPLLPLYCIPSTSCCIPATVTAASLLLPLCCTKAYRTHPPPPTSPVSIACLLQRSPQAVLPSLRSPLPNPLPTCCQPANLLPTLGPTLRQPRCLTLQDFTEGEFGRIMGTNFEAAFHLAQLAHPHLKQAAAAAHVPDPPKTLKS